ncbi:DUF6221 family protein [Streptomyces sp. NPDC051994]|uniref:DUF6221 family protein n=1 Tax=unclassified Streptomyces TaxID=2593676 RepID=UPI00342E9AC8
MTADLVQFLRDRLDEDERAAHWADDGAGANWEACFTDHLKEQMGITEVGSGFVFVDGFQDVAFGAAVHAARHDPARVLREVDAKRSIVDAYVEAAAWFDAPENRHHPAGEAYGLYTALRLLALPYADHPDYQEWRLAAG